MQKILEVNGRYMIPRDYPEVIRLEQGYNHRWTAQDYMQASADRHISPYVFYTAGRLKTIVGVVVVLTQPDHLSIVRILVERENWRRKVGTQILNFVNQKLWAKNRQEVFMTVEDNNLDAQLFLRSYGYKAVHIIPSKPPGGQDCYLFRGERGYSHPVVDGLLTTNIGYATDHIIE